MYNKTIVIFFTIFLLPTAGYAENDYFTISGFLTTAMTYGDNEEYTLYHHSIDTDDFELAAHDNRVGFQIDANVSDNMRLTTQLLARAPDNDFNLIVNWAYVDFKFANKFNAHIGKFRLAQFLVSEYAEVGYAYPWIRPPQDVYGTNPMVSLSGLDMFYHQPIGSLDLVVQIYYGDGYHTTYFPAYAYDNPPPLPPGAPDIQSTYSKSQELTFRSKNTYGINVGIGTDFFTFRLGHLETKIDQADFGIENGHGSFTGVGFNLDLANFITYAEYVVRDTDESTPNLTLAFPDQTAWYITIGYRFGSFLPHYTYSILDEGKDESPATLEQQSSIYGLRYQVNNGAALKFEILRAIPKQNNYGLFDDIIGEATLYSLGMDFIF